MLKKILNSLCDVDININSIQIAALEIYVAELLKWNSSINLTAITDISEIYEKHILDSLLVLPYLDDIESLLDIGSGAGLPGIIISIMRPELNLSSVESIGKKINFQKNIKRKLNLQNFQVLQDRVENLQKFGKKYDATISRAFSSLDNFFELSLPLSDKKIIAMKGPEGEQELSTLKKDRSEIDPKATFLYKYELPVSKSARSIIVFHR